MGYVVIKASGNAYALNRSMQNLTPVDSNYRKLIPNNATFAYKHVTLQGICTLDSVDLKNGTLPYEYRLCDSLGDLLDTSRPGVLVNPINGVITLGENYDEQDVWVRLYPLIKTGYYATNTPKIYVKAVTAGDWSPGITPEPTVHTASLDSVVYSFGDIYNWNSNSLTAAATLLNLASVTVTYDGQLSTFSGNDLTTFINDVTDPLILGLVSDTSIVNLTSTIRQFTVPANPNSNQRTINFTVSLKYKGILVSYTLTNGLMQAANTLVSIDSSSIKYQNLASPITLNVGTTLNASDFTATGTFSNGTTNTISATGITLNGTSVNSVAQDLNTYTLTFANNITGTYTITGQAVTQYRYSISKWKGTSTKSTPYGENNSGGSVNNGILSFEPEVTVIDSDTNLEQDYTLSAYNALSNRTPYQFSYTVEDTYNTYNAVGGVGTIAIDNTTGTLSFDLNKLKSITKNFVYSPIRVKLTLTAPDNSVINTLYNGADNFINVRKQLLYLLDNYYFLNESQQQIYWSDDSQHTPTNVATYNNSGALIPSLDPYTHTGSNYYPGTVTISNGNSKSIVIDNHESSTPLSFILKLPSWNASLAIITTTSLTLNQTYAIAYKTGSDYELDNIYSVIEGTHYVRYTVPAGKYAVILSSSAAGAVYYNLDTVN